MKTRSLFRPSWYHGLVVLSLWWAMPRAQGGALSGIYEVIASASTINLTTEGTIDWAHWGRTSPSDFNRRAGVTQQISNFTLIGSAVVQQFDDNFTGYSWTNGTPVARITRTTSGIYVEDEGNGFEISVPADTTLKTLKVYVGVYAAQMRFEASLSDSSAPPFLDESFQNESDGPNRAYVLNFAANSSGQKLTVRLTVMTYIAQYANVTLQAAALRDGSPLVELLKPVNGAIFHAAADGVQFRASTISPNSLPSDQVKLFLNGADVSASLAVAGSATARTAAFNQLETNRLYQATITVGDSNGQVTTNNFSFDTFSQDGTVVVEAEDFNYGDGVNGGKFLDHSAPNAYQGQFGMAEVDYHWNGQGQNAYRGDPVAAVTSTDQLRQPWVAAGVPDYLLAGFEPGDWVNYTRTFPEGKYHLYLRYAGYNDQVVQLDQVTSDPARENQSLKLLGTINAARTGNENSYRYAAMTDALGKPLVLALSGKPTVRLTGVTVDPSYQGLRVNFLLFVPATTVTRLPFVDQALPAPDAENVAPDTAVSLTILNGDTSVAPGSINLGFDQVDVTSLAAVSAVANGATVRFQPAGLLPMNSPHTVTVAFSDNASPPARQTNTWTFLVANLPIIQAEWGTAPGSGRDNGFVLKMAKAPNDLEDGLFTNTAARAELQLAGKLIDPQTAQPVFNEAAGANGNVYDEAGTINYQQDGNSAGYFPGDRAFPLIDTGDPNHIALEADFFVDLAAGVHRFGVRSDDGFRLTSGASLTNATLELGQYEGGRASDLPAGSTEFEFLVQKSGVYPFRLIYYEGTGGADLEIFSVERSTLQTTNVVRTLLNDSAGVGSVKTFRTRVGTPLPNPQAPTIAQARIEGNSLTLTFGTEAGFNYVVQSTQRVQDAAWIDTSYSAAGDGTVKNVTVPMSGAVSFYRLVVK